MAKKTPAAPVKTLTAKPAGSLIHTDPRSLVMVDQYRTETDEKADRELLESIRMHGVQTPIKATKTPAGLQVIAGHRRTRMAIEAELATVPVYVTEASEDDIPVQQLVENLQRLDASLSDTARSVWLIYTGQALGSAQQVAALLGKPKAWVSKMLTIGDPQLHENNSVVRQLLARDLLTDMESAYMLCNIEKHDKPAAESLMSRIVENDKAEKAGEPLPTPAVTRAVIAAILKAIKNKKPETTEPADGGSDGGDPVNPDNDEPLFTADVLAFMKKVITDATVKPADMDKKTAALAAIAELMQEAGE